MTHFLLPSEIMAGAGVPDEIRLQVAYMTLAAKYCALVEAVMKLTDGEPVTVSLERTKEIVSMDVDTDPALVPMVVEEPVGDREHIRVRTATRQEVEAGNRRERLHRMGTRRN